MQRPKLSITRWSKKFTSQMHPPGQAMVEYVLILALVIISLAAILSITGPAVGNVFSNTVANLLDLTVTPEDPMTEGDFWQLVTAVASYTPDTVALVGKRRARGGG
jgi:Flp pilus assembly pilin Flp